MVGEWEFCWMGVWWVWLIVVWMHPGCFEIGGLVCV